MNIHSKKTMMGILMTSILIFIVVASTVVTAPQVKEKYATIVLGPRGHTTDYLTQGSGIGWGGYIVWSWYNAHIVTSYSDPTLTAHIYNDTEYVNKIRYCIWVAYN